MINQSDKWRIALQPDSPAQDLSLAFCGILGFSPEALPVDKIISMDRNERMVEILFRAKWLNRQLDDVLDLIEKIYEHFFKVQDATGKWYFTLYPDEIELLYCIQYALGSMKHFNKYLEVLKASNETGIATDDSQLMRLCMAVDSLTEAANYFSNWTKQQARKQGDTHATAKTR